MPDGFTLVLDGGMLLGVGGGHYAFPVGHVGFAPNLEKLLRHFQVELLARHLVKLDQGQLHLLVAGGLPDGFALIVLGVSLEEDPVDVEGVFLRHLEQLVLAGGLIIGDGGLVEVAHIVELVAVHDEGVGRVSHHVLVRAHSGGVRRVEIAVRFLGGCDDVDDAIELGFEFGVILQLGQVGGPFHDFVKVGIDEPVRSVALHFLARKKVGRGLEVGNARLGLLEGEGNQYLALGDEAGPPEFTLHLNLVEGDGLDGGLAGEGKSE